MAEVTHAATPPTSLASVLQSLRHTVPWRFATVALLIGILWAAASFLTRTAHDQRVTRAKAAATRATAAVSGGQRDDAVALFREAVGLEPRHPDYRLALAKALVAVGRPAEAEPYVQEVLRQQPVNGEANLVLAHAGGVTGPHDLVPPTIPRRRVVALRPALTVGLRRPRAEPGQRLHPER